MIYVYLYTHMHTLFRNNSSITIISNLRPASIFLLHLFATLKIFTLTELFYIFAEKKFEHSFRYYLLLYSLFENVIIKSFYITL